MSQRARTSSSACTDHTPHDIPHGCSAQHTRTASYRWADADFALAFARIENHYFTGANGVAGFFPREGWLLEEVRSSEIQQDPARSSEIQRDPERSSEIQPSLAPVPWTWTSR